MLNFVIQLTLHLVNGFKRDRSTPSKEKRAKEPSIQRTSYLVNENCGYGARLLNAMLNVLLILLQSNHLWGLANVTCEEVLF